MTSETKKQKILSICIPTKNRKNYLEELLNNINYVFEENEGIVELIIADNNSNDGTGEILNYYSINSRIQTTIISQKVNVSVQYNLISCFLKATGRYVLFLGDDDRLIKWNFIKLLDYLANCKNVIDIIIQPFRSRLDASYETTIIITSDPKQYYNYFYDYGNAYGGIIRGELLHHALRDEYVLRQALVSVWPQTILAFSSLIICKNNKNIRMLIVNCRIGYGPYSGFTYISSTYRTTRSFIDLYLASITVEFIAKKHSLISSNILGCNYLVSRLSEICFSSCVTKTLTVEQSDEIFLRFAEFESTFFVRKMLWLVSVSKSRFFFYVIFKIYYFILKVVLKFWSLGKFILSFFLHNSVKIEQINRASGVKDDSNVF